MQQVYSICQNKIVDTYSTIQRKVFQNHGTRIMNEDWDNLIILDACRYDLFKEINTIDGTLQSRISMGSSTPEFLNRNFNENPYYDTVYVSAIPMVEKENLSGDFYDIIRTWESLWNSQLETVPPRPMSERVKEIEQKYPNKRIIAHFLQPHYPFIGPTGNKIPHPSVNEQSHANQETESSKYVWAQLRDGDIGKNVVWKAYKENLEIALPHVQNLIDNMDGKTVVTSDHGNGFGEWGVYGHPTYRSIYLEELVKVPWLEIDYTKRKVIHEEKSVAIKNKEQSNVNKQLKALGYTE